MLTKKTAIAIANCHAQIQNAEELLTQMQDILSKNPMKEAKDIRDVFGQQQRCMELGIPSGGSGHRILHVEFDLAAVIIEAQIEKYKQHLKVLNILASTECVADGEVPAQPLAVPLPPRDGKPAGHMFNYEALAAEARNRYPSLSLQQGMAMIVSEYSNPLQSVASTGNESSEGIKAN